MKRFVSLSIIIIYAVLSINEVAENTTYPFEVKVSGKGRQSILFIPGITSSDEVSDRKTFAEMYCDFSNTDLRTKFSSIKCHSLILLEPSFTPLRSVIKEQFKNLKTANIQFATKRLHFIMLDDNEWFVSQLTSFVKQ